MSHIDIADFTRCQITVLTGPPRCYLVSGQGVYLGAFVVVFALSEAEARTQALPLFPGTKNTIDSLEVRELPQSGASLVWDGNY